MAGTDHTFDVVVVGGGPAGISASIAAARLGARTLLVERSDVLGGNAGNALVHTICGLYLAASDRPAQYAHEGVPVEFAEMLQRSGAAAAAERVGRGTRTADVPPSHACGGAGDVFASQGAGGVAH